MMKQVSEIIKLLLGVKKIEVEFTNEEQNLIYFLYNDRGASFVADLSSIMNKSKASVISLAESVSKKGIEIYYDEEDDLLILTGSRSERSSEETLSFKDREIKIGLISDSLLGSKYQQLTALHKAHQIAEHCGVDFMIHLGVSAGHPAKAQRDEFFLYTAQEQANYIAANYPYSSKYKTRFISGYHDMKWRQKEGKNVLLMACRQREDLLYRGDLVSDFPLRRGKDNGSRWPILRAAYRGGDNSPYSKSYPVQGFQENLIQDINDLFADNKPDIGVVAGQGVYLDLGAETVDCLVSIPGMRDVPPSVLRKKNRAMAPTIGFVILTIKFLEDGNFFVKKSFYPLELISSDYRFKISDNKEAIAGLSEVERKVLQLLDESPRSIGELSQAVDVCSETVFEVIKSLRSKDYSIEERKESQNYKLVSRPRQFWEVKPINFDHYFHKTIEEGALSDTHFGSMSDLIPIQEEAFDIFKARGITEVNHIGDLCNGPSKHKEHLKGEVYEDRATPLVDLCVQKFPLRKGITTHIIGGNHDGWFADLVGMDFVRHVADLRSDLDYLGPCEGYRQIGKALICLKHYDWGTGYARSYKPQMVIETILKEVSKERKRYRGKSIVVLSGGGHVYCSMVMKGVVFILMPCLQGKTGFVNRLGKISDVGFIIFSITYSKDGKMTCFSVEHFDRIARARELERKRAANERRRKTRSSKRKVGAPKKRSKKPVDKKK